MIRRFTALLVFGLLCASPASADDGSSADAVSETLLLAETILEHHVLPPTRQEMLVAAVHKAYRDSGLSPPLSASREISDAASPEGALGVVREYLDELSANHGVDSRQLLRSAQAGLSAVVLGDLELVSAEDERVNEQFRSNRYVGTGIALSMSEGVPKMAQVFPDGPADSVGAMDGDRIEEINGESTTGMSLERVVEVLRGPEGTDVTVTLRQPDEAEPRVVTITRGVVPLKSISEYEIFPARDGVVACVRIDRLTASCVHELRQIGEKIERDGAHGLILDLRTTQPGTVHHAVLLADAFLDGGPIGQVSTRSGSESYVAESGELFPELKIGLIVGSHTRGTVEWVAAALQDGGRAVLFGDLTSGQAFTNEAVPTGRDGILLTLPTGLLERPSGYPLLRTSVSPLARDNLTRSPEFRAILERMYGDQDDAPYRSQAPWGVLPDSSLTRQGRENIRESAAYELLTIEPRRTGSEEVRRHNTQRRSRSR